MRVWQVRSVLWLVGFIGAYYRSSDHITSAAAAAYYCVIAVSYTHLTLPTNREV